MEAQVHRGRIRAICRSIAEQGFDALVVTHRPNILYLSGFSGDSGVLLIEHHRTTLFTDTRFTVQAAQEVGTLCRVEISPGPPLRRIGQALAIAKARRVGFDPEKVTVAQFRVLKRAGGVRVQWRSLPSVVEGLRIIKSAEEIALMHRAAALGSEVMEEAIRLLKPGVRECDIAAEVAYRMRKKGAQRTSFETIVAFGARSALPHARPTTKRSCVPRGPP